MATVGYWIARMQARSEQTCGALTASERRPLRSPNIITRGLHRHTDSMAESLFEQGQLYLRRVATPNKTPPSSSATVGPKYTANISASRPSDPFGTASTLVPPKPEKLDRAHSADPCPQRHSDVGLLHIRNVPIGHNAAPITSAIAAIRTRVLFIFVSSGSSSYRRPTSSPWTYPVSVDS